MQKKFIPKICFFYCFYEWKEGGQNQSPAIEYEGKKHPIKSKVKLYLSYECIKAKILIKNLKYKIVVNIDEQSYSILF